nr:retrovirus-related Pol polyprotein from transposon TNT 1-94 [Tanacetum cinerariifolium]
MMNELIKNQCKVTNHQVNVQFLLQLQPEWQRFVTLVKQSQELKIVSYHKLYDILKQHQHEVNEIRAEKIARVANPLALVAQQKPIYHPQTHPTHYTQNSSTRSQQAATRNRGKAIINSPQPIFDQEPSMVTEDDKTSKDKEIDKLMALISLSFKKIYKPTNNNLRTSSNTSRINQDNSPRINKNAGYENQRIGNVAGARETVAREYQKPKKAKDAAYHREKMLLCKQEEAGIQLNTEQVDWRDDTDDDELEDQELEAHYMYMAQLQEVSTDAADSGPIFDDEPLQKVSNDDHYNVFAIESAHPEQSKSVHDTYPIEQDTQNVIIDSLDMNYDIEEIDQNDDDNDLAKERGQNSSIIITFISAHVFLVTTSIPKVATYKFHEIRARSWKVAAANTTLLASMHLLTVKTISIFSIHLIRPIAPSFPRKVMGLHFIKSAKVHSLATRATLVLQHDLLHFELFLSQPEWRHQPFPVSCGSLYPVLTGEDMEQGQVEQRAQQVVLELANKQAKENYLRTFDDFATSDTYIHRILDKLFAHQETISILSKQKEAQIKLYKTQEDKELEKVIELENKVKVLDNIVYKTGQSVQTINMLNNKCRTSFAKPKFLKKAQSANPRLYDIGFYNDNLALMLAPDSDEVIRLEKESRSKLSDLIRPFDYDKLNNLYDLFVPQREKSSKQRVILATSVSRPQLKSNPQGDRIMHNNSRGKKQEVEDQRRSVKFSENKTSVTACNDSLNAKTLNVNSVSAMKSMCFIHDLKGNDLLTDHLCSSCELGKAKRKAFHTKLTLRSKRRLQLLHMDLVGPMRVASINGKRYVLVLVDDYSRYTWTHFLRSKNETPEVLIDFLRLVQRGLQAQVRVVQADKGMEFL